MINNFEAPLPLPNLERSRLEETFQELVDCFQIIFEELEHFYSDLTENQNSQMTPEQKKEIPKLLEILLASKTHVDNFLRRSSSADAVTTISERNLSLIDQSHIKEGEHPGIYIDCLIPADQQNKIPQIGATLNMYGGYRDRSEATDFRDTLRAQVSGQGHAERTDRITSRPRYVGLDIFISGHQVLNCWIDFPSKSSRDTRIIIRRLWTSSLGYPVELPGEKSLRYPEELESMLFNQLHGLTEQMMDLLGEEAK